MKNLSLSIVFICSLNLASAQWFILTTDFTPNIAVTAFDSVIIGGSPSPWAAFDLAVSYNYGQTWEGQNLSSQPGVSYLNTCDSMIYACAPTGVYRTAKNQMNWLPFSEGLLNNDIRKICFTDSVMLSISYSKVFKRIAGDSAWTTIVETSPVGTIKDIDFNMNLIAMAGSNGIAESYDWGQSWTLWPPGYVHDWDVLTIKGDTLIVAGRAGIYRKVLISGNIAQVSNGLAHLWSPYPPGYYFGYFYTFHQTGDQVFVSGETGVYLLSPESWTWIIAPGTSAIALTSNQELLIAAAGYNGLRARPLAELTTTRPALALSSISVYPNPTSEFLTVEAPGAHSAYLSVLNLSGCQVMQQPMNQGTVNLNISNLPQAMYIIKIECESDVKFMKFVRR